MLVPTQIRQQPTTDYFQAVQGTLQAFKDGSLGQAIGQTVVATTPIVAAARAMKQRTLVRNGMGQTESSGFLNGADTGKIIMIGAAYLLISGALSYQAGKAMAPNRRDVNTWGWVGVPVGIFTGAWGLGVMGIVSNSRK